MLRCLRLAQKIDSIYCASMLQLDPQKAADASKSPAQSKIRKQESWPQS